MIAATLLATMMLAQNLDDTGTAVAQPVGTAVLEPVSGSYFRFSNSSVGRRTPGAMRAAWSKAISMMGGKAGLPW